MCAQVQELDLYIHADLMPCTQWTSKTYDFDKPLTPLPPLIHLCCREAVRAVPWGRVFEASETSMNEQTDDADICRTWKDDYEPEAGIINFVSRRKSPLGDMD